MTLRLRFQANYQWTQTLSDVEVRIPLIKPGSGKLKGKDVTVIITRTSLKVGLKGKPPVVDGPMYKAVLADECTCRTIHPSSTLLFSSPCLCVCFHKELSGFCCSLCLCVYFSACICVSARTCVSVNPSWFLCLCLCLIVSHLLCLSVFLCLIVCLLLTLYFARSLAALLSLAVSLSHTFAGFFSL
jgi:hypothetical protein